MINLNLIKRYENEIVVIIGVLIYFAWYKLNIYHLFSFSYIHFSVAHIGYLGLLFIPSVLVFQNKTLKKLWILFSTIAILDLQPLMYIVNEQPIDNSAFTNNINIFIIAFLFLLSIILSNSKPLPKKTLKEYKKYIWLIFISALFFFTIYHCANYYLNIIKHVPNEDRSIFINGLEFHHINYGIALLTITPLLVKYFLTIKNRAIKTIAFIFIGFIYGTVYDESFYYMLQNMTDNAYLELIPTSLSILIMLISIFSWYNFLKK